MGADDHRDFGPEHKTGGHLSDQFLGTYPVLSQTTASSMSACEDASSSLKTGPSHSANISVPLLTGDWDHITPAASNVDFSGVSSISAFNASLIESHGIHCSNISLTGPVPRIPGFIRGSYPEAVSSFAYSHDCGITVSSGSMHLPSTVDQAAEKDSEWKKRKCLSDSMPFGPHSSINTIQVQNIEPETEKDPEEKNEKRQRNEQTPTTITRKPNLKQTKEQPQNGSDSNKDYIHIRAKRGQATNSHSLAERVRREKISERMRYLQNLVPGCSKVTGKAVMLDEIINYVQSLQRQVEFLSMKLATVNPELNYDIEQLLSKNILHLRGGPSNDLVYDPGLSSSHPHTHGFISQAATQSEMVIQNLAGCQEVLKIAQFSAIPPESGLWDDELQRVFQMGFIPNMPVSGTDLPESMKLEQ